METSIPLATEECLPSEQFYPATRFYLDIDAIEIQLINLWIKLAIDYVPLIFPKCIILEKRRWHCVQRSNIQSFIWGENEAH